MNKYFLPILGSSVDSFYRADSFPQVGDFTHAQFLGQSAGGCSFNVGACVAAKGIKTIPLDMLGTKDETTNFLLNECARLKMSTDFIYQEDSVSNGKVIIINTEKERTMFVIDPIRPAYKVDEKIQNLLNGATYIYSLMHMINRSFSNIEPLLEAKRKGTKIVLDGSSKYDDPSRLKILYSLADGLFINETDYGRLKEASNAEPKDIILNNGGEFVCITNGSKGANLYTKENQYFEAAIANLKVLDSTGAGDGFAGGFIACLMLGYDYQKALKVASANGAYACSIFGGLGGAVSLQDLKEFAEGYNYEI